VGLVGRWLTGDVKIVARTIDALIETLEEAGNPPQCASAVQGLLTLPAGSLRTLLATQHPHNYRLAWV
jgi:hypothetical protein